MRVSATLLALAAAALLTACPGDSCTTEAKKETVFEIARSWYLFPELLDPNVDPAAYPDAQSMLDALVAPAVAAGKDKGWSFLSTAAESQTYFGDGEAVGYGFGLLVRDDAQSVPHLRVAQVFPGSAAADALFARGDDILAIGPDEASLVPVSEILATGGSWREALGPPSTEGVTRTFEVRTLAGATEIRTVTTSVFDLSPVVHRLEGKVGIVVLRTFISTAEGLLTEAVQSFRSAGVTDVVVDVRYNGGGLVSTAQHFANLLSADHQGEIMYKTKNNAVKSAYDASITFAPPADAIQPLRVAFITTGATASASELVPNALEPYLSEGGPRIALVGDRTYGKPVGQRGWTISSCGDVLYLVSFELQNKEDEGEYFAGLPDTDVPPRFSGPLCPAEDDLTNELGDPLEASTAAAIYWLENGRCPDQAGAAALSSKALVTLPERDRYPAPSRPSLAQSEIPGLF